MDKSFQSGYQPNADVFISVDKYYYGLQPSPDVASGVLKKLAKNEAVTTNVGAPITSSYTGNKYFYMSVH
jgi:hypothetical protein